MTLNLWEVDTYGAVGFAVGDSGTILKTADYGATWSAITGVTTEGLMGVSVASPTVAYITGQNGATFRTADAGATWTSLASGLSSFNGYAIDAYSASVVYLVGKSGGAYKSTNSGTTWTALTTGVTSDLYAVDAVSATIAYAAGQNRTAIKTTNGSTFSTISLSSFGSSESVFDIGCSTTSLCFAAGDSGTVMSTSDGSTWAAQTVPGGHSLGALANYAVGKRFVGGFDGAILTYDNNPPTMVSGIALAAGGTSTTDTTPEIIWSDTTDSQTAVASYAVDVDSTGTYTNVGDVNSYTPSVALSVGSHTISVIAVDLGANNSNTSSFAFTVATAGDITAPVVGAITPTSVTAGVETVLSVTFSDSVGVTSCTIFDEGSPASMIVGSASATYAQLFEGVGAHTMYAVCSDAAGNIGTGATTTVTVVSSGADTTAPTVSSITPIVATVGVATSFSATVSDDVGIASCYLYVNGVSQGGMTVTSATGKAALSYTPSAAGTLSVYALCKDASGNTGSVATTSVVVSSATTDVTAPVVGAVTPITATVGVSTTFSATYSDDVGVVSCTGYSNGIPTSMALVSGTASVTGTISVAGTYTIYVTCVDAAGNVGTGSSVVVTASAATSIDTTNPTVSTTAPTTATQNTAVTFSATATDASGIYACYLMVDGNSQGIMTASSSTYSRSYTPAASGTLSVYTWCGDMVGNVGEGSTVSVVVAAAAVAATDVVAPTVGAITPTTATENTALTLSASVADSGGMGTCTLYVNSTNIGSMTIANGYATRSYTFTASGSASANAYCVDAAGNATRGATSTITVGAAVSQEEGVAVGEADIGSIIKLACGTDADAEDPCHAVYYYDGKRHAFPNEKVYMTWYTNYDDVIIVTADFLSSITLGYNVTYHPGTTMVKFVTVNTVYAVGENGELRAVASEDVAASIWGSDWNTQIEDVSDAFYGNYTFGDDINSTSDFDPTAVDALSTTIAEILQQ